MRIGNVRCRFMGEKVIIYSIQIHPEFQCNGYATTTIDMLKGRYAVIVADRIRFIARSFWEKMGFSALPDGNCEYQK